MKLFRFLPILIVLLSCSVVKAQTILNPAVLPPATSSKQGAIVLGGDLSTPASAPIVQGIQGRHISATTPTNAEVYEWITSDLQWEPTALSGGGSGTVTDWLWGTVPNIFSDSVTNGTTTPAASFAYATGLTAYENDYVGVNGSGAVGLYTLPTALPPSGSAGSDIGGTYPSNVTVLSVAHVTTGTLSVGNGGTGVTTLTNHGVVLGQGASAANTTAAGTSGQLFVGQGATADPAWETASGDATVSLSGGIVVTKTNGVAFAASATTDTTNASNISSGTIPSARLPFATTSAPGAVTLGPLYVDASVPSGNTIANTTSETAFASSYTIPANSVYVGQVLKLKLMGGYSTALTPTINLNFKIDSTVICTTGVTVLPTASGLQWSAEVYVVVTAIGASGSIEVQGTAQFSTAATTALIIGMNNSAPFTGIDTTTSHVVTVTVTWGTASASDGIKCRIFLLAND